MGENIESQFLTRQTIGNKNLFVFNHPLFSATISEFGGQLLSFIPVNQQELIWLSDCAIKDGSKPIRGGAPICWPWFGPAPEKFTNEPQHGYARNVDWEIIDLTATDKEVKVSLIPKFSPEISSSLGLNLKAIYTFSESVNIELVTENTSDKEFELNLAIHTYFSVGDIHQVQIDELAGQQYFDKLTAQMSVQEQPLKVQQAMDNVYQFDKSELLIKTQDRDIKLSQQGHDSIVVWNPWQQGAEAMADFDDRGYLSMLCVEAALTQGFKLQAGKQHTVSQAISL